MRYLTKLHEHTLYNPNPENLTPIQLQDQLKSIENNWTNNYRSQLIESLIIAFQQIQFEQLPTYQQLMLFASAYPKADTQQRRQISRKINQNNLPMQLYNQITQQATKNLNALKTPCPPKGFIDIYAEHLIEQILSFRCETLKLTLDQMIKGSVRLKQSLTNIKNCFNNCSSSQIEPYFPNVHDYFFSGIYGQSLVYNDKLWQSELSDIESESDWQAIDDLDYLNLN